MRTHRYRKNQFAFSLTELMVSITLGLLITWGIIEIFSQNKSLSLTQRLESNLNENIRFSKNILIKEIRMAGFIGCNNLSTIIPNVTATNLNLLANKADYIKGYEGLQDGSWSPQLPNNITGKVKPFTDVLTIRKGNILTTNLATDMSTSASDITINQNNLNIKKNDLVVISDCSNADIFRVSDINNQMIIKHTQPENISLTLLKPYRTNAEITLFENITYYLKDTGRLNNSNNKIYTLYSIDSNNNEIELIDGVENLKIEYKIYQNNSFSYYTAKYIESNQLWDKIIAVKLNITFNSIDTLLKNGKPELIKKTITTIIYLRNK